MTWQRQELVQNDGAFRVWTSSVHPGKFWALCLADECRGTAGVISDPALDREQINRWIQNHRHAGAR